MKRVQSKGEKMVSTWENNWIYDSGKIKMFLDRKKSRQRSLKWHTKQKFFSSLSCLCTFSSFSAFLNIKKKLMMLFDVLLGLTRAYEKKNT